jgi:hypothetical protein
MAHKTMPAAMFNSKEKAESIPAFPRSKDYQISFIPS